MRSALVGVLFVCLVWRTAFGGDSSPHVPGSFTLPPGYTEVEDSRVDGLIAKMRSQGALAAEAHVYDSPDQSVQLTTIGFLIAEKKPVAWADLEHGDDVMTKGFTATLKPTSESRNREGSTLVGQMVGDLEGRRIAMRRIHAVDKQHVIHTFAIMCVGDPNHLAECTNAQQSMRLAIENQVMPASKSSVDSKKRDDAIFQIATIVLLGIGIGVVGLQQGRARLRRKS